jgi:hypothetical protein
VADEDDTAADPADRCLHQGDVLCRCVEAVLRCNTLIPLRLKGNDQLAETRAIGPKPVTENDAWLALGSCHFALLGCFSYSGFVLQRAGISPENAKLKRGLAWLTANQDKKEGSWASYSLNKNKENHLSPETALFMNDAATSFAVLSLTAANRR